MAFSGSVDPPRKDPMAFSGSIKDGGGGGVDASVASVATHILAQSYNVASHASGWKASSAGAALAMAVGEGTGGTSRPGLSCRVDTDSRWQQRALWPRRHPGHLQNAYTSPAPPGSFPWRRSHNDTQLDKTWWAWTLLSFALLFFALSHRPSFAASILVRVFPGSHLCLRERYGSSPMTSSSSSKEAPPPLLPASEQDFLKSLFALRSRDRIIYTQSLALTHGESLLPLLEELLATQPAIHSIPIPRPPKADSELNADGGNPAPEIDNHVLKFPQTNAPSRYIQRNAGLTMAINLAQKGGQGAIALLLANLNHPHQPGKKGLIQCLAACATDQDILTASADSAPAVRDSLVAALNENKRKDLTYAVLGKPRPVCLLVGHL